MKKEKKKERCKKEREKENEIKKGKKEKIEWKKGIEGRYTKIWTEERKVEERWIEIKKEVKGIKEKVRN